MRADIAYLVDYTHRIALLSYLARVKKSIGIAHKRANLLTHPIKWHKEMDIIYDPVLFAELLKENTGIDIMKEKDWNTFRYSEANSEERARVTGMFAEAGYDKDKPYIVFSMYTSHISKDCPEEYWQDLRMRVGKISDSKIVLTGANPKNIKFGQNCY